MANKRYVYKAYRDGTYITDLPDVISDFEYTQDINNPGPEIAIEIGRSLDDVGATVESENLVDETGADVVDEFGNPIITDFAYAFNTIPINLANKIEVWMFDANNVNGVKVFSGLITSWKTNFNRNTIVLRVMSYGVKLSNYLITIPSNTVIEYFDDTSDSYSVFTQNGPAGLTRYVGQSFTVPTNTTINSIELLIAVGASNIQNGNVIMTIIEGIPGGGGAVLGQVNRLIDNTDPEWQSFQFSEGIALASGTTYSMIIQYQSLWYAELVSLYYNPSGGYANGQMYTSVGGSTYSTPGADIGFKIYSSTGGIGYNFTNADPSNMLRTILDKFIQAGGPINYTSATIEQTDTIANYNFKFNTVLEGVQKCLEMAPADWYWYVDRATNLLHFHYKSSTPDHTFILGEHLHTFELEYTLEDMANVTYFSGGDTGGGANLLRQNISLASLSNYGQWMRPLSDNRVSDADIADLLSLRELDRSSEPSYRTVIEIPAGVYDIETIEIGQAVAIKNAGDFVESLLLQIVSFRRKPDIITLYLDSALPTVTHRIEDLRRNVLSEQTRNNPDELS